MGPREEDLVPVKSEDELRPGLWVFAVRTGLVDGAVSLLLMRPGAPVQCDHHAGPDDPVQSGQHGGWFCATAPIRNDSGRVCLESLRWGIRLGRLFRLKDPEEGQETTRERERERVE